LGKHIDKTWVDGKIFTRPDEAGAFDELVAAGPFVHMEMMDDKTLWIGLAFPDRKEEVHVTISAASKLSVIANEA
jgi:hypothetical protein